MKRTLFTVLFALLVVGSLKAQNWTESFEGIDSTALPAGWTKWNAAPWTVDEFDNWTVRDSGLTVPGLSTGKSKSHSGLKSIGVSWVTGVNDSGTYLTANAWLVSKRIRVWSASSYMSYWMALGGGSGNYLDSVQIWVSTTDSLPSSFTHYVETLSGRGPYGTFSQNFVPIGDYVGQTIWVGFRYNTDVSTDGYFVNLDDIEVDNPIGIQPISTEVPKRFELKQNYPNPFNPVTNIEFSIVKGGFVNLVIFNALGQQVSTLVNQDLKAGSYKYDFNASGLPSGTYYYRLTSGDFTQTNKMILVK